MSAQSKRRCSWWKAVLTVGWEEAGNIFEQRIGRKDLVLTPPNRPHFFRNDGVEDAQFFMVVGTPQPETVRFKAT